MRLSLSFKIILSMTIIVFLTALTCCVVSFVVINNQARTFDNQLEQVRAQIQPLPAKEQILEKIRSVVNNPNLNSDEQSSKLFEIMQPPALNVDNIKEIAANSGMPIFINNEQGNPKPDANASFFYFFTNSTYRSILMASLISVFFAVSIGVLLSRAIVRPLRRLEYASEHIANGNYSLLLKPAGDDDIGRLATSFNKMSQVLLQTEQRRKDLVVDLSHEFSTPLSGIQGYTEALRDGLVKTEQRRTSIYDHILSEVDFLNKMVNSIRLWAKDDKALAHLNLTDFEIEPIIQNVVYRFANAAERAQVNLEYHLASSKLQSHADPNYLNHIISNLVDNALRYTPSGGSIQIKVTEVPKQAQIWFEVSDTGSGIPAEHLPFVFERFYRVDKSRDRATGGSGLGLAIVRDAVLAQGGEIKIESTLKVGTKVRFYLPKSQSFDLKPRAKN